jgi:hypothetical protein
MVKFWMRIVIRKTFEQNLPGEVVEGQIERKGFRAFCVSTAAVQSTF